MVKKNTLFAALFVALCSIVSCTNYAKTTHHGTKTQLAMNNIHVVPSFQQQMTPIIQHRQVVPTVQQQVPPVFQQQAVPSFQYVAPTIQQQVVPSIKQQVTPLVHQQVVPSFNYMANQPQLYNGVPNMQYLNYVPNAAGHTQFAGSNVQYRKNGVHGYGKQSSPLSMSTPVVQRGFYSDPSMFGVSSLSYTTPMFSGGYGGAFYSPYPKESFLGKAGKFVGKNLPLILAGGAVYALARG